MKIALAADLHFGSVPEGLAGELRTVIDAQAPDVVVIAGDLTLRARHREFEQAKAWLSSFEAPTLVLPGNHDLPYFNLVQRFHNPFHRYSRAAGGAELMPVIECPDGIVLGFNTTRPWQPHFRWQEGTARLRDIETAKVALSSAPAGRFKAVAAHHPLMKVPDFPRAEPVRRAKLALSAFAECGVDLIMSGTFIKATPSRRRLKGSACSRLGRLRRYPAGRVARQTASGLLKRVMPPSIALFGSATSKGFRGRRQYHFPVCEK